MGDRGSSRTLAPRIHVHKHTHGLVKSPPLPLNLEQLPPDLEHVQETLRQCPRCSLPANSIWKKQEEIQGGKNKYRG